MNDTQSKLRIATFCLSDWMSNCFVLHRAAESNQPRPCWVIDPGFDAQPVVQYVSENNLTPQAIILTHGHVDHIAGVGMIREQFPDTPIWIHDGDRDCLTNPERNLSAMLAGPVVLPEANDTLQHGQWISLDGFDFEIRHVPGHSPGGIVLYQKEHAVAIVGDALFAGSIGRSDFPGGDHNLLVESIKKQILTLPDETRVLSGHGGETTVGREKTSNPFLI